MVQVFVGVTIPYVKSECNATYGYVDGAEHGLEEDLRYKIVNLIK